MTTRWGTFPLLASALALILSGCVTPPADQTPTVQARSDADAGPHVLIAMIDSGINPYHAVFRDGAAPEPKKQIAGIADYETVDLSFDLPLEDAISKDAWATMQRDQLYWFKGTRILGVSLGQPDSTDKYPIFDDLDHGTGTASVVANVNSEAYILMIEGDGSDPSSVFSWISGKSWIDVVSDSIGLVGNVPTPSPIVEDNFSQKTRSVTGEGRPLFIASGNEVNTCTFDRLCGPPWVIAVGGVDSQSHGESLLAGKLPDFVSDYTTRVARGDSTTEYRLDGGTSYAAPMAAAVASKVILETRKAWQYGGGIENATLAMDGHGKSLTATGLRLALNRTAQYFNTTDYNGTRVEPNLQTVFSASVPVAPSIEGLPIGPWVQMGWGYVSPAIVNATLDVVLGRSELPEKPDAQTFLDQVYALRSEYWRIVSP